MKLIVGLGNPGKKYAETRHNIGYMVVDRLAGAGAWKISKRGQLEYLWLDADGGEVELIKPQTMMNNSGKAFAYVRKKHQQLKLSQMYIVHDDLDIKLGEYKIQMGKGPRVHGGLQSIYERFGSNDFWHVRVGIENRIREPTPKGGQARARSQKLPGKVYVLQRFTKIEREVVDRVIDEVVDELHKRLSSSEQSIINH